MTRIYFLIFFVIFFSQSGFSQKFDEDKGLLYFYVGGTAANLNTNAEFEVSDEILQYYPSISTSIDLEDDLDFPATSELFYIKAIFGKRLQLLVTYFSSHREGGSLLTKSFAFGENTYSVSAPVSGFLNTDYYAASVRYSFVYTPVVTAGLSLGFRYLKMEAGIRADSMGFVFDERGSLDVPAAVPGIHASVYPINNLLVRGSLEYFSLQMDGTKGTVFEGQLSAEYYILKNVGLGVGYSITSLKAEDLPKNDIYLRDINYKVGGFQVFAALRF